MAKTSLIYGVSFALHGALAVTVASIDKPVHRETIAIEMAESKKKTPPEPPKPAELPKTVDDAPKAERRREARAKAAPAEAKAAPPPVNASSQQQAALDALPDFGLAMDNGGSGGLAVQSPGAGAALPSSTARPDAARAPRVLAPKPEDQGCSDPIVKPKPKAISQPAYTPRAREAGIEGRVRVEVSVDETGRVTGARLLAGLGYGLDEAALEAAKRATFDPATRCGKPVRATFVIAMRFSSP